MFLPTQLSALTAICAVVALLQDTTSAASLTRKSVQNNLGRRQNAPNPGRGAGCGQVRSNVPEAQFRNQCVCFNPNTVAVFGQTPEVVTYANNNNYIYPRDVSASSPCAQVPSRLISSTCPVNRLATMVSHMVKGSRFVCSSYVKYQETVSSRPEDPLLSFLTTAIVVDTVSNTVEACDDLRAEYSAPLGCTYGSCGEGSTLVCLNEGEQCQSGIPVPSSVTRRSLAGRECPTGKVIKLGVQVGSELKSFLGST